MEDNPYLVKLAPDEFDELLSAYENFVEWCKKEMTEEQLALAGRVLNKLRQADADHVCVDEETVLQDMSKDFPITSVTRADLISAGFSETEVAKLTDSDMQQIASAMEDLYCDSGYWEDVELCAKRTLARKDEDALVTQKHQSEEEEEPET